MGEPLEVPVDREDRKTAILAVADASPGCPNCGWAPVEDATFCSQCGARLAGEDDPELLGSRTGYAMERRLYGVPPPEFLCALGAIGFVAAIVLLAAAHWVAAGIVLLPALTFAAMFFSTAERFPESRTARASVAARRWLRGRLVVAGTSLAAWSHAVAEIARLAWKQRKLRAELDARVGRLGEAVYADDPDLAGYLKAEAHVISEQLDEVERRRAAVSPDARRQIDQARGRSS